jgi:NitT/TauT family transport system substrate-binding protein
VLSLLRRARIPVALAVVTLSVLTACGSGTSGSSASGTQGTGADIRLQLSWLTNAQNGGWSAADEEGYFRQAGLGKVTLQSGGPNVSPVQLVAAGRADVGITTAENYIQARAQGIPIIAVGADFNTPPTGIMFKTSTGWQNWPDLAGKTWTVSPTSIGWKWVKRQEGIDFTTANYNGSIAAFLTQPLGITQAFPTNEFYTARKQGADVKFLSYSSTGYNPYGDVEFVRQDYLAQHADTVRALLAAGFKGWGEYMSDVEVAKRANQAILAGNNQVTPDATWYAWETQRSYVVGDQVGKPIGRMDDARWSTFVDQLNQLGVINKTFAAKDLYTNDYLPADVIAPDLAKLPKAPAGSYTGQS